MPCYYDAWARLHRRELHLLQHLRALLRMAATHRVKLLLSA
jgi:hypothetical protein